MTSPSTDGPMELLAALAEEDGKIRLANYENHMDLTAIAENMIKKMKFKTGEYVRDFSEDNQNG